MLVTGHTKHRCFHSWSTIKWGNHIHCSTDHLTHPSQSLRGPLSSRLRSYPPSKPRSLFQSRVQQLPSIHKNTSLWTHIHIELTIRAIELFQPCSLHGATSAHTKWKTIQAGRASSPGTPPLRWPHFYPHKYLLDWTCSRSNVHSLRTINTLGHSTYLQSSTSCSALQKMQASYVSC